MYQIGGLDLLNKTLEDGLVNLVGDNKNGSFIITKESKTTSSFKLKDFKLTDKILVKHKEEDGSFVDIVITINENGTLGKTIIK